MTRGRTKSLKAEVLHPPCFNPLLEDQPSRFAALPKQERHQNKGEIFKSISLLFEFLFHSFEHKSVCYLVIYFWEEQCVCLSALCVEHSLCVLVCVVLSHYARVCVAGRLIVCVCVCVCVLCNLIACVCVCVAGRLTVCLCVCD